jgi:hypothetical protein
MMKIFSKTVSRTDPKTDPKTATLTDPNIGHETAPKINARHVVSNAG